jgi:hypothetical protein
MPAGLARMLTLCITLQFSHLKTELEFKVKEVTDQEQAYRLDHLTRSASQP